MNRLRALLAASAVLLTMLVAVARSADATTSKTCGPGSCVSLAPAGSWLPELHPPHHGAHVHVEFRFVISGAPPSRLTLTAHQYAHFPILGNGSVDVYGDYPNGKPSFSVVAHRTSLAITFGGAVALRPGQYFVDFTASPDRYARAAVYSTMTALFTGTDRRQHTAAATNRIAQGRPELRAEGSGVGWPRAGHSAVVWFKAGNTGFETHEGQYLTLQFSRGFTLDHRRGVRYAGHRVHCSGTRHVRCKITQDFPLMGRTVRVNVHAARHLHRGHRGQVRLTLTPIGYDNLGHFNTAREHMRVR